MTPPSSPVVSCPTCHKKTEWRTDNEFRPFCSERCKLIDLGDWASEAHKIPSDPANDDEPFNQDSYYL